MLHLDIEVETLQFFINSQVEQCSIQIIDTFVSKILDAKIKCRCTDIQEINEKIELDLNYAENKYLKIVFFDKQSCFGEALLNLGFYIENNLPMIIDKISINNRFDQDAYIQVCLAWNQNDQVRIKQVNSMKTSKNRECVKEHKLEQQKLEDDVQSNNKIIQQKQVPLKEKSEYSKSNLDKKIIQTKHKKQQESKQLDQIQKQDQLPNTRDVQTPKRIKQPIKIFNVGEHYINQNGIQNKIQNNNKVTKIKNQFSNGQKQFSQEDDEIIKGQTKQKPLQNQADFIYELSSRPTQIEHGLMLSCKQLDRDENDINQVKIQNIALQNQNNQLKQQIETLNVENETLKFKLKTNETLFNNNQQESYRNFTNDIQKNQISSFTIESCNSLLSNMKNDENLIYENENLKKEMLQIKLELQNLKQIHEDNEKILQKYGEQLKYYELILNTNNNKTNQTTTFFMHFTQQENITNNLFYPNKFKGNQDQDYILNLSSTISKRQFQQDNLDNSKHLLQYTDSQLMISQYKLELANLQKENQQLSHQAKKYQVKFDGYQKELEICKKINELQNEKLNEKIYSLEKQIQELEKLIVNGKQNIADILNLIFSCGEKKLLEEVIRCLAIRRSVKIE